MELYKWNKISMKKIWIISILYLFTLSSIKSQIKNDSSFIYNQKNIIGITGSGGFGGGVTFLHLDTRYGYFLPNRLNLGFNVGFEYIGTLYKELNLGPNVRYYVINKYFTPIIEFKSNIIHVNVDYSQYISDSFDKTLLDDGNNYGFNSGIGLGLASIPKKKKLGIDLIAMLTGSYVNKKFYKHINYIFRLNYHFNKWNNRQQKNKTNSGFRVKWNDRILKIC